jgi:hypothetical protein
MGVSFSGASKTLVSFAFSVDAALFTHGHHIFGKLEVVIAFWPNLIRPVYYFLLGSWRASHLKGMLMVLLY